MAMHRVPLTTSERKCCIKGCGSINMFKQCHQFPATLERREAWLRAIGPHMDDDLIGQPPEKFKSRVVCVEHFVPSYFSGASSRFLKRSAIPTQFPDLATLNSSQTRSSNNNQAPAVNQGMVIPKEKIQSNTNLYQINKRTTAPTEGKRPATAHPTLLVEPLQTKDSHTKKRPFSSSTESKTELPMFYISSMYGNDGRKHKPALKITKVFPNRKEQPTECITDSKSVNDQLATVYMQESLHANFDADPEYFEFDREPESQGLTDVQSDNSQLAGDNSQMDADDSNADTEESRLEEDNSQVNLIVMQENENADTGNVSMKLIKYVNNNPENIEEPAINTNTDIAAVITHAPYEVPPVVRRVDSTPELPECVQYVLLGGGTACVAALKGIRKHDHKAKVLIVSQEYSYPYDRRMLSKSRFWKSGDFSKEPDVDQLFQGYGESSSLYHNPESYYIDPIELTGEAGGVGVARGYTVRRVDPVQHSVVLSAIGRPDKTVVYGKCLIATGVHPKNIPVLENSSREVQRRCIMLRCIDDAMRLWKMLERARSIVVVGGGFLGSEMACALAERLHGTDTRVTLIFRESGLLWHILPDYLARWSTPQLATLGINVCPKTEILNAYMSKNRVTLELSNAEMVEADVIVVCAGSIPNTDFAAASHIETHPQLGGIIVNSEFCVQKDLYAAGDVACFYDPRVGRRRVEHWQQAVQSGFIAGVMMAGAEAARLRHSEISSRLLPNLRYEAIGIIDSNLEMMGAFPNLSHGNDKNYDEGVVFYLQQREIVGVLLWNLHNRLKIARQLLNDEQKQKEEINELADLFIVHGSDEKSQDCTASLELDNEPTSQCYECAACDEIFANKSEIIEHIATSHRQEYCCEICTRKFTTKLQLKKHYSTHFNCRPSVRRVRKKELTQPTEFNLANQFKCVYCVKSFRFMADLKMHLRKDHPGRTLAQRRILVKGKPLVMTNLKVIRKVIP